MTLLRSRALVAVALDSFREAKDRKISRVLFALSLVIAGLMATLGYREVEPAAFLRGALAGATLPSGAPLVVRSATKTPEGARGASVEAEIAVEPSPSVPVGFAEDALDQLVEAALRRALEDRGVRVDSVAPLARRRLGAREPHSGYALRCGWADPLDVGGLMRISAAGLTEFDLVFGEGSMGVAFSARYFIANLENFIGNALAGWFGIIIAIVATAGFVPSLLQGGTTHLFLAKPAPRWVFLLGKYLGGVAFVAFHATLLAALVATAVFARTGWFDARFLLVGPILAGLFAIVYAISCVAAVLFETPVVSVLLALGFWLGCSVVAFAKHDLPKIEGPTGARLEIPKPLLAAIDAAYWVLPKPRDLGQLAASVTLEGREPPEIARLERDLKPRIDFPKSAASSAAFTAALLAAGCVVFRRRDY